MSAGAQNASLPDQPGLSLSQSLSLLDDRVLAMIAAQDSLPKILDAVCIEIEKQRGGLLCSVLLLESDGVTLRHGAAPSLPQEFRQAIDGAKIGPCAGSCGTALYRKHEVVVSDIAADPLWADYRHLALPHGLRACWSTPIPAQDGSMLGSFAVYYREPLAPDAQHLQLIAHATRLVALAIERDRGKIELSAVEALDRTLLYRTMVERFPAIADPLPASPVRGTETVLLVEDQDGIRDLVCEFLQTNGYTVLYAADGEEALAVAAEHKHPIHLLLTDVVMPNVGGQELARSLAESRPQMKVLFMSGYLDHAASASTSDPIPTAAILQKPFSLEALAKSVRNLLDGSNVR